MQCICIDMKSFYASCECVARGLDPLTTNLVVADETRTEKTICLAVTPSLKRYGISGRARLFDVKQKVEEVNRERLAKEPYHEFTDSSAFATELDRYPSLRLDYIVAMPRMAYYMEVSAKIYDIYLRYIAPEDIHVYSIDEVFIDATGYLTTYHCTAHELALRLIREVLKETGITATAGIGTNLYLAKVAMDIVAKKMPAYEDGVRIAELDEITFREQLWSHRPLKDFWRIGPGIAAKLEEMHIFTMGELARYSMYGEDKLFKKYGVNAELLIDHAWGYEPCPMSAIQSYQPQDRSISSGQVLSKPYEYDMARVIVQEMAEQLSYDLVAKGLVTNQIILTVNYDSTGIPKDYAGELTINQYGKKVPKQAHGSIILGRQTASTQIILSKTLELYRRIVDSDLRVRKVSIAANHVIPEDKVSADFVQFSFFDDVDAMQRRQEQETQKLTKEHNLQKAMLGIKARFGKNAVLKGINMIEGATMRERNQQVGGHKA